MEGEEITADGNPLRKDLTASSTYTSFLLMAQGRICVHRQTRSLFSASVFADMEAYTPGWETLQSGSEIPIPFLYKILTVLEINRIVSRNTDILQ